MNEIKDSCCLVTGGAGFVGSTIVDALFAEGAAEVRVLDNFVRGSWDNLDKAQTHHNLKVTVGDICDVSTVEKATEGADYIFHQAALRITRCAEAPREAVEVLIGGTLNVLEAAVRHGIKKLVSASSASVYGNPTYLPMDESHPFNNRTVYGAGKIANEQLMRAFYTSYGLPYVALRYFNVYGPRMDQEGVYTEVMIRWLDAIENGRSPLIFGDGSRSMDFVFVKDVARANLAALRSEVADDVFNVGTGTTTTLKELCHLLLRITDSDLQPEYCDEVRKTDVLTRRASTSKAAQLLGYKAEMKLEDGLTELVRWRQTSRETLTTVARRA